MKNYDVVIEPDVLQDIQQAIDFYDDKEIGLGEKFLTTLNEHIATLSKNPFFQIRYDAVHCLPLIKYPYMIHFTIDESQKAVTIRAIFHTALDPSKWTERK